MSRRFDEHLAGLPLVIDDYTLERAEQQVSSAFLRVTTTIRLRRRRRGRDRRGRHLRRRRTTTRCRPQGRSSRWPANGRSRAFCDHVEPLDLWPAPPQREPSVLYRVWAYESAALDLALRQAGTSLHDALGDDAAAADVRHVAAARRPADARAGHATPGQPPDAALQARRGQRAGTTSSSPRWRRPAPSTQSTSRASTRARSSTRAPTPSSTSASSTACPTRGSRIRS